MRFTYIVDEKVSGRYGIMKKDYKVAVAGTGARDIIRGCHNRDKGTAENERLRNPNLTRRMNDGSFWMAEMPNRKKFRP